MLVVRIIAHDKGGILRAQKVWATRTRHTRHAEVRRQSVRRTAFISRDRSYAGMEANKGTAAGRYLNPMTVGGTRSYKSTERQMQRVGLLRSGEYLMPTGVHPLTLNSHGNLSGPVYMRVLSRIKGLHEMGFTANVSPSRRSQRKRAQSDFFITTGESRQGTKMHRGIYARVGPRPKGTGGKGSARGGRPVTSNLPRGFHTVFYITRPPVYRPTFPVPSILNQAYERAWGEQLQRSYQEELAKAGFVK